MKHVYIIRLQEFNKYLLYICYWQVPGLQRQIQSLRSPQQAHRLAGEIDTIAGGKSVVQLTETKRGEILAGHLRISRISKGRKREEKYSS